MVAHIFIKTGSEMYNLKISLYASRLILYWIYPKELIVRLIF